MSIEKYAGNCGAPVEQEKFHDPVRAYAGHTENCEHVVHSSSNDAGENLLAGMPVSLRSTPVKASQTDSITFTSVCVGVRVLKNHFEKPPMPDALNCTPASAYAHNDMGCRVRRLVEADVYST